MKKLFTLLTLLVAIVTGAWAQTGTALSDLNFSYPTALPTAYTLSSTNTPIIATAGNKSSVYVTNGGGTTIPTFSSDNSTAPTGGKRWMAFCPAEDCDVKISVYSSNKTFYIWDKDKKTTSDAVASYTNSDKAWEDWEVEGLKAGTWYVIGTGNSQCYVGAMTFTAAVSDGKTNLVGAWTNDAPTFEYGEAATAPTFDVTPTTATPGAAYSVAYSLVSGSNVTVDATNGITAIDTNTPGESVVKATITVIDGENYKATQTEYETTITVNPEQTVPEPVTSGEIFSADVTVTSNQSFAAGTVEVTSTQATISGGKVYAINGQSEAKDLIAPQSNIGYFCMTNNNTYFKVELNQALAEGDIITAKGIGGEKSGVAKGIWVTSTEGRPNSAPACAGQSTSTSVVDPILSYTVTANDEYVGKTVLYISRAAGASTYFDEFKITRPAVATETYTVTFNAGSNGTCATTSLTEATPGAGVVLPSVTANEGYTFDGWFTAATEGTKVGDAGETYKPSADVEIFAQYLQPSAPTSVTISGAPTAAVVLNQVVKLTATVEGAVPDATVDWLDESDNVLASATTTYTVPTTALGPVKVKARATNESGSVSSDLVTINVIDPNKTIEANEYFISVGEQVYPDEKITGTDIALTFVNGKAGESFTAGVSDNMISGENSKYVASISGSQNNNGWKAKFEPTANGILKVGVVINNNKKTFSITPAENVTSFSYKGKNNANPQEAVEETVEGNSLTTGEATTEKLYVEVTLNVEANKEYSFSVAGSKMGFYGFTFTPTVPVIITSAGAASFSSTEALDFSAVEGITAYKATAKSDSYVHLDEVAQVPAGAGVIVKGAEGTYNVPVATGDVAELEGNLLLGTAEAAYTVGDDYGKVFKYVKRTSDNVVGFQKAKADWTCQVGHAYLKFSETQARDFIGIFGEEEVVTGIDAIENGTIDNDAPAYNLAGQKVGKGYKGIVIINGKKVVK